jgi:acetyl esterase/lipase
LNNNPVEDCGAVLISSSPAKGDAAPAARSCYTFDIASKVRADMQIKARNVFAPLAAVILLAQCGEAAKAQTAFYTAQEQELAGRPGTIIRNELMRGAPTGAAAYRVLYRSTGLHDEPIAVSGVVVIPAGPAPEAGRPIVAWAHPTTGVVPHCAPSLAHFVFQQIQGLRELVNRGYVVTATDYPGLGTVGPHPYLVGVSEARAVLDSVRAARELGGAGGGRRYAVWGHSQGGQASLYGGILAKSYAPDLQLVGIAAAAPATELAVLMADDLDSNGGRNLTAMTLWSWQRVYDAPMERVVEGAAIPVVNRLAEECIESPYDLVVRQRTASSLEKTFLSVPNPLDLEPWRSLAARNTPGALPSDVPVFLSQGEDDKLVRPNVTRDYLRQLCDAGSSVQLVMVRGVGHGFIARDSASRAVAWMSARFAGTRAPSDCNP